MFNGIIYNQGTIKNIKKRVNGLELSIKSDLKVSTKDIGISISCDGVCLTMINYKNKMMNFYLSNETIEKSNFKNIKIGKITNLELPLKFGTQISGHIIQGHVDCTGKLTSIKKIDRSYLLNFSLSSKERKNLVNKASISINGVSLTIAKITTKGFQIWVIPHTYKLTNLSKLKKNDLVNIEIDILSKYVRNYINEK
tara:strand:- start:2884 stop:3474 length:591 start_codon:yes stop_codon:yes gene_type:complete